MHNPIVPLRAISELNRRQIRRSCCCLQLNFNYLTTYVGLIKILELVLCGICKFILTNFGLKYASIIGFSYDAFLTIISASLVTTFLLVVTCTLSERSTWLIRSSLFEVLFNGSVCINFFGTCSWLLLIIQVSLYPTFLTAAFFVIYPLMLMVNVLGFLLAIFYGIDCYLAYKYFMGNS